MENFAGRKSLNRVYFCVNKDGASKISNELG